MPLTALSSSLSISFLSLTLIHRCVGSELGEQRRGDASSIVPHGVILGRALN